MPGRADSRSARVVLGLALPLLAGAISLDVGFSGGAVLQRGENVTVFGNKTAPGSRVTILLDGRAMDTVTSDADGSWMGTLPPQDASWIRMLSVHDATTGESASEEVRFGEVVLCSGQSNMQMPVANYSEGKFTAFNGSAEVAAAGRYTGRIMIRSLQPPYPRPALGPWNASAWNDVLPTINGTLRGFSAVCWYTGKALYSRLGETVPVGLMAGSVGGSPIEAWIPNASIAACGGDTPPCDTHGRVYDGGFWEALIRPLAPYTVGTVVWDQGERDVHCFAPVGNHTAQYPCMERELIRGWRHAFRSEFVFVGVQLPGYIGDCDSTYANPNASYYNCVPGVFNMRLAQDAGAGAGGMPRADVSPTWDLGCPFGVETPQCPFGSVHNVKKARIGDRIALQAMRMRGLLPRGAVAAGPRAVGVSAAPRGAGAWDVTVRFSGGSPPMFLNGTQYCAMCCGGPVGDFDASSDGRTFVNGTQAQIGEGMTVRFSVKLAERPTRVRFTANQGFPQCGVYNAEGFPAYPFELDVSDA